jgi:AraC family transcriptional regulator of adaptative response/methylated-DNA-[protein]-cysteine methyltransferase
MTTADAERVTRAIRYLEQHSRVQPSLEAVAAAAGLSPYHFQRLFRRWAGVSPKRFLQFLTIGSAREALREGRSVLESAYDAGLSGPGRLHDLFVTFDAVTPGEFKSRGTGMVIDYGFVDTPFGDSFLALTERGICGLAFLDAGRRRDALADFRANWPGAVLRRAPRRAADTARRIFRPGGAVERLMLDLRGTNFQIKVWEALLRIPPGSLVSYADLAGAVGQPRAHRAVASAVARNPVGFLIPCHRVIRQSGRFGEYRWGTERKQAMIGWEAAQRETTRSRS